jgi:alpha-L-rhamnosidase
LIAVMSVEFDQGQTLVAITDETWKSSDKELPGWNGPAFDDSQWTAAKIVAKYGGGAWGAFEGTRARRSLTPSPVLSDPFLGTVEVPAEVDRKSVRAYLVMDGLPDNAACVRVNGALAGGCIGKPAHVNVTAHLRPGKNTVEILPQAPENVKLVMYPIR